MDELLKSFQTQLDSINIHRLSGSLVYGDCLDYKKEQLIIGLNAFAMFEKMKKQWFAPCQTSIPQYYSQPTLSCNGLIEKDLNCLENKYSFVFNLKDFSTNFHVANLTSITLQKEPVLGQAIVAMDGTVTYLCDAQNVDRTVFFEIGLSSHYSNYVVRYFFVIRLKKCKTCDMSASISEVQCFTAQINEQE